MALSEIYFVFPKILIFVEIDFSIRPARFNSHPRVPTQNKKNIDFSSNMVQTTQKNKSQWILGYFVKKYHKNSKKSP